MMIALFDFMGQSQHLAAMKLLSIFAVLCLQLSVFACTAIAHGHDMHSDTNHIEQHQSPVSGDNNAIDYPCQAHAAHTFIIVSAHKKNHDLTSESPVFSADKVFNFRLFPSIDHPPIA